VGLAEEFYKIVAEPVSFEDIKVGDAINIEQEFPGMRVVRVVIVTKRWIDPDTNEIKLEYRQATNDDVYAPPTVTVFAK
jgi:hypothetical protein